VKGDLNVGTSQLTKSKYLGEETFKSSRRDMFMVTYSKALGQLKRFLVLQFRNCLQPATQTEFNFETNRPI